ncbi:Carboxypeptidase inhibitor, partial [Gryllus bimaculatus]
FKRPDLSRDRESGAKGKSIIAQIYPSIRSLYATFSSQCNSLRKHSPVLQSNAWSRTWPVLFGGLLSPEKGATANRCCGNTWTVTSATAENRFTFSRLLVESTATWITRDGPPEPVSSNRRRSDKLVEPYESRCVHQGGICRYARDCPKGQLTSTKGLCPEQQKHGVECCYARPTSNNTKPRKSRNSQYRRHQRRYNSRTGRNEHPSERKMG